MLISGKRSPRSNTSLSTKASTVQGPRASWLHPRHTLQNYSVEPMHWARSHLITVTVFPMIPIRRQFTGKICTDDGFMHARTPDAMPTEISAIEQLPRYKSRHDKVQDTETNPCTHTCQTMHKADHHVHSTQVRPRTKQTTTCSLRQ